MRAGHEAGEVRSSCPPLASFSSCSTNWCRYDSRANDRWSSRTKSIASSILRRAVVRANTIFPGTHDPSSFSHNELVRRDAASQSSAAPMQREQLALGAVALLARAPTAATGLHPLCRLVILCRSVLARTKILRGWRITGAPALRISHAASAERSVCLAVGLVASHCSTSVTVHALLCGPIKRPAGKPSFLTQLSNVGQLETIPASFKSRNLMNLTSIASLMRLA